MKQLTGSEIVIECLKEQGVDTVFGYPGGTILNVYDALYKHQDEIHHVLTSHEQGASHAADGYARATGKVGVCMATSGPGATNLVTGIATAYMDSIPLVAITANVGVSLLGKDSFSSAWTHISPFMVTCFAFSSPFTSFRLPKPASAKYLSIRIFAILHQSSHFQTKEEDPQSTRGSSHSYYQSSWGD